MVTSGAENMITLLATLGIDAGPSDRSTNLKIDRFAQWADDDQYATAFACASLTSLSPAGQPV